MNREIPYGFMPQFNYERNELKQLNEKIDYLEKKIKRLEKKIEILEGNNFRPYTNYPNNMI